MAIPEGTEARRDWCEGLGGPEGLDTEVHGVMCLVTSSLHVLPLFPIGGGETPEPLPTIRGWTHGRVTPVSGRMASQHHARMRSNTLGRLEPGSSS